MMIEKVMIQLGAKNLKSSCRMMIEKVMIQLGAKSLKSSYRMMIEKVMIQLGVQKLAMLTMQEGKAKNQLGKQRMRKAKEDAK